MRKECPECRGQRKMYYVQKAEPDEIVASPLSTASADAVLHKTLDDCRLCRGAGLVEITDRIPVYQFGVKIGTVPHNFDPDSFVSRSIVYRPRRGDFQQVGYHFDASPSLGNGDLEAVAGFQWERD